MEEFIEKYSKWFSYCDREKLKSEMRYDLCALALRQQSENNPKALRLPGVVFNGACKCEKPDPFKQMPYKCFRCHGKIEVSEVDVCDCTHTQACKICGEAKGIDGDFWSKLQT